MPQWILDNVLIKTDEEEAWSGRDVVLRRLLINVMERVCEKKGSFEKMRDWMETESDKWNFWNKYWRIKAWRIWYSQGILNAIELEETAKVWAKGW